MHGAPRDEEQETTIRDVFPEFNEEELREAEAKLVEYVEFSVRLYDRIRGDPEAYARFKLLTAERKGRTMENEGPVSSQ